MCPVLFAPYKRMDERLAELLAAVDDDGDRRSGCGSPPARRNLPPDLASQPPDRVPRAGSISTELRQAWARSRAIYFPTGLESFGYPLAEARANGQPVIARDTAQNREIAGPALCGFQSE